MVGLAGINLCYHHLCFPCCNSGGKRVQSPEMEDIFSWALKFSHIFSPLFFEAVVLVKPVTYISKRLRTEQGWMGVFRMAKWLFFLSLHAEYNCLGCIQVRLKQVLHPGEPVKSKSQILMYVLGPSYPPAQKGRLRRRKLQVCKRTLLEDEVGSRHNAVHSLWIAAVPSSLDYLSPLSCTLSQVLQICLTPREFLSAAGFSLSLSPSFS